MSILRNLKITENLNNIAAAGTGDVIKIKINFNFKLISLLREDLTAKNGEKHFMLLITFKKDEVRVYHFIYYKDHVIKSTKLSNRKNILRDFFNNRIAAEGIIDTLFVYSSFYNTGLPLFELLNKVAKFTIKVDAPFKSSVSNYKFKNLVIAKPIISKNITKINIETKKFIYKYNNINLQFYLDSLHIEHIFTSNNASTAVIKNVELGQQYKIVKPNKTVFNLGETVEIKSIHINNKILDKSKLLVSSVRFPDYKYITFDAIRHKNLILTEPKKIKKSQPNIFGANPGNRFGSVVSSNPYDQYVTIDGTNFRNIPEQFLTRSLGELESQQRQLAELEEIHRQLTASRTNSESDPNMPF